MSATAYLGFAAVFGGVIAGRFVTEAALRKLTVEQKAAIIDGFADLRRYNVIVLAAVVLFAMSYPAIGLIAFAALYTVAIVLTYRRLQRLNLPPEYVRAQVVGTSLPVFGLIVAAGAWWWPAS